VPAVCQGSPALSAKYGMSEDNRQDIVQVRNRVTEDVAWFNARRKQKPQQFVRAQRDQERAQASSSPCDFCEPHWRTLTAQDVFGRIEGDHCVTASNLFKYVAPYQGLVFLKHKHEALDFSLEELMDYLNVSARWFGACKEEYMDNKYHSRCLVMRQDTIRDTAMRTMKRWVTFYALFFLHCSSPQGPGGHPGGHPLRRGLVVDAVPDALADALAFDLVVTPGVAAGDLDVIGVVNMPSPASVGGSGLHLVFPPKR